MREVRLEAFGPPDLLELVEDVPAPEPGPGEVLVAVSHAGLNPLDVKMRDGSSARSKGLPLPAVLGREVSGHVLGAGPEVDLAALGMPVGTAVFGVRGLEDPRGTYAETVAMRAEDLAPIPPRALAAGTAAGSAPASDSDAEIARTMAAFGGLALAGCTALTILEDDAELRPGQTVLVHGGTGGVGQLLVPLALRAGAARVLATGRAANAERLRALGAEPIPYDLPTGDADGADADPVGTADPGRPAWVDAVLAATDGRGVDLVVDTHFFDTFEPSLDVIAPGGRIVAVPSLADVSAAKERGIPARITRMRPTRERLERLAAAVADRDLDVEISEVLPLGDVARGHEILGEGHARGKLVLDVRA